ncbi:MAG: universal stress protein [Candidatus Dactylopiibacterium sp.]|nr:universal stress protein [Candidatus Dactylopiibacterium sp.]
MFRHILAPTDGSPLSLAALAQAARLAREHGARLTLFHALIDVPAPYEGPGTIGHGSFARDVREQLEAAAREILDEAQARVAEAGVPCERCVAAGAHAHALIIAAAEAGGCDLIFMASHGRRGLSALLLGSETQKVLTHTRIPVLVYR